MSFQPPRLQSSVLFVRDVALSRQFYEGLLGQTVEMDFGANVGFQGGFAIWQVDHALQTIHGRQPEVSPTLGADNFELYFETDDLDAVWDRLALGHVPSVHPLREQPWGQRVFRVSDPDGHIVEVGEPMPVVILRFAGQGMDAEAISQRTSMPVEIVRQVVQGA
jgi:catechol 2,3-dioxygenase-like lactoylglutathione lyase family enzyme